MICVMMRRSEMQVFSVKFWRCSPISVHARVARSRRFGRLSRANERADRGRTHQPALSTSTVQAAASAHSCGHALAFCAPHAAKAAEGRQQRRAVLQKRPKKRAGAGAAVTTNGPKNAPPQLQQRARAPPCWEGKQGVSAHAPSEQGAQSCFEARWRRGAGAASTPCLGRMATWITPNSGSPRAWASAPCSGGGTGSCRSRRHRRNFF